MPDRKTDDEKVLIDFLRGELTPAEARNVQQRLAGDESFRRLNDDLVNTFAAMKLCPDSQPPEDLVEMTMARIRQVRRTEALLAKEESRRLSLRPTFSLRELTGIAAAMILMAVIFIPMVRQRQKRAVAGRCASNAAQIGTGILAYANANDEYLPGIDSPCKRWLATGGADAFSNSSALYKLIRCGYASPLVFSCPAGGSGSFQVKAGMSDFPDGKFIGYSYQHTRGPQGFRRSDPAVLAVADRMAILADSTPLFVRGRFRPERIRNAVSENHGGAGQNVLYLDSHVEWVERPTVGVRQDNIFLVEGLLEYRGDEVPSGPTDSFLLPAFSDSRRFDHSP